MGVLLLTHYSAPKVRRAVSFLWHFPYPVESVRRVDSAVFMPRDSPCYGPPCPAELGLSSPHENALMKSDHRFRSSSPLSIRVLKKAHLPPCPAASPSRRRSKSRSLFVATPPLALHHCGVRPSTPHSSGLREPCIWAFLSILTNIIF